MRRLLDTLGPSERFALIKLAGGALRIGVSARLAKQALADFGGKDVGEIEELWHGLRPPFTELFAWLEGRAEKPVNAAAAPFRPVMLSNALEERDAPQISPDDPCRGVEMGRHPRPGGGRARRAPALFAHRRRHFRRVSRRHRGDGFRGRDRRRTSGRLHRRPAKRNRHILRPAAAAEPQERVGEGTGALSGLHPRLRPARRMAARISAPSR